MAGPRLADHRPATHLYRLIRSVVDAIPAEPNRPLRDVILALRGPPGQRDYLRPARDAIPRYDDGWADVTQITAWWC